MPYNGPVKEIRKRWGKGTSPDSKDDAWENQPERNASRREEVLPFEESVPDWNDDVQDEISALLGEEADDVENEFLDFAAIRKALAEKETTPDGEEGTEAPDDDLFLVIDEIIEPETTFSPVETTVPVAPEEHGTDTPVAPVVSPTLEDNLPSAKPLADVPSAEEPPVSAEASETLSKASVMEPVFKDVIVSELLERGVVTLPQALTAARGQVDQPGTALWRILADLPGVNRATIFEQAANLQGFPTLGLKEKYSAEFIQTITDLWPPAAQEDLFTYNLLPLKLKMDPEARQQRLVLVTHDPTHPELRTSLQGIGMLFDLNYAPEEDIANLLTQIRTIRDTASPDTASPVVPLELLIDVDLAFPEEDEASQETVPVAEMEVEEDLNAEIIDLSEGAEFLELHWEPFASSSSAEPEGETTTLEYEDLFEEDKPTALEDVQETELPEWKSLAEWVEDTVDIDTALEESAPEEPGETEERSRLQETIEALDVDDVFEVDEVIEGGETDHGEDTAIEDLVVPYEDLTIQDERGQDELSQDNTAFDSVPGELTELELTDVLPPEDVELEAGLDDSLAEQLLDIFEIGPATNGTASTPKNGVPSFDGISFDVSDHELLSDVSDWTQNQDLEQLYEEEPTASEDLTPSLSPEHPDQRKRPQAEKTFAAREEPEPQESVLPEDFLPEDLLQTPVAPQPSRHPEPPTSTLPQSKPDRSPKPIEPLTPTPEPPPVASPTPEPAPLAQAVSEPEDADLKAFIDIHLDRIRAKDRVVATLLRKNLVSPLEVKRAQKKQEDEDLKEPIWRVLTLLDDINRTAIFAEAASVYAFKKAEIGDEKTDPEFARSVMETFDEEMRDSLLRLRVVPLEVDLDPQTGSIKVVFITHDPARPEVHRLMQKLRLERFELRYAPEKTVTALILDAFPRKNEFLERMEGHDAMDMGISYEESSELIDEDALEAEISRSKLINLFEATLVEAVRQDASDVHIWPNAKKQVEIHFRIDGRLRRWHVEDKVHPEAFIAVVKDNSMNVDRFEREAAQDGFIQRWIDEALIRFRVSILPIANAIQEVRSESIVIRVLDDRKVVKDLSKLGLNKLALERFRKAISQPHGMVILTGPTGSGKTTTLYASIHEVINPEVNVLTVEDPVEYILPGVRQIKLNKKLGLDGALRSILRHDPDVVMVGEMRDQPTAELAIKLANTGHLTFSTLHTNDAASAVTRLYKMGIEPFLIAYAINLVVAQRLIRRLCPTCKKVDPDPDPVLMKKLGFTKQEIKTVKVQILGHDDHCPTCNGTGFKGRRAVSEAMYFSREIRHLIADSEGMLDENTIKDMAVEQGMMTLSDSARNVVLEGDTSLLEMMRVVSTED